MCSDDVGRKKKQIKQNKINTRFVGTESLSDGLLLPQRNNSDIILGFTWYDTKMSSLEASL